MKVPDTDPPHPPCRAYVPYTGVRHRSTTRYWHFPTLSLKFSECHFEDPDEYTYWVDCNDAWAKDWGMVGVPNWVPLIVGLVGTMMVNPYILQVVGFPRNFLQHGIFLIVQAMFANIGYCGKIGVATGYASIAVGVIDIIASAFHIKSDRMKDLQLIKDHPDYQSHEDDDSEE
ncbi:Luminal-binding protein 5 [Durusdinium trenchii]|uniref:Luminal-binding protein 5 n=1 Tax=Durusdinium trenchii TaxID=1381693 RepID=A0ABP0LR66_9DINO